ncbi:hypothetical protein MTR_5g048690 [Medicago truncatula]|uniref:Retrovirus-related Pol polyprotein from transposon TNT 1-94-like beta-barrel domain-containing protein n=1 Tax=Medicago truncatula TaxID=3880 RepID=A0A072UFM2_MEDTR|nr:hypothetical protein MTR_5g048690 [Medicago truncatula]
MLSMTYVEKESSLSIWDLKSAVRAQPPLTVVGATDVDTRSGIRIRRPRSAFRHQTSIDMLPYHCFQSPLSSSDSPCCSVLFGIINNTWVPLFRGFVACLSHCVGSWISDSSASDHVVGNPSLISNLSPPNIPHNITLANGSKEQVTGIGQASPLPSLSLNYVLFVPGCPFNLISISKLTDSLNCSITFSSKSFCIQDCNTWKTIGTGYVSQGLYYLHS